MLAADFLTQFRFHHPVRRLDIGALMVFRVELVLMILEKVKRFLPITAPSAGRI